MSDLHGVSYLNLPSLEELSILALRHGFLLCYECNADLDDDRQSVIRSQAVIAAKPMSELHTASSMPPQVKFTPRSSLDSKVHSTVDGALKELKLASRELQKVFASFRLELELLDRLFYKNKNQHRGALFWRKVTEMRRFGHRLDRLKPDGLVEDARRWFWGPSDRQK